MSETLFSSLNTLVIDNDNSDINYQKSNIDNNVRYRPSLDELNQIFKQYDNDIFDYDTSECIILIMEDGSEMTLYEYRNYIANFKKTGEYSRPMYARMLKITNEILTQLHQEIIIYILCGHFETEQYWQIGGNCAISTLFDEETALCNTDGYNNSYRILKMVNARMLLGVNAIEHCVGWCQKFGGRNFHGYLPAIGQLIFIHMYADLIDYLLGYFNEGLSFNKNAWWSSTEYSDEEAWCFDGTYQTANKTKVKKVFPLFKEIYT